MKVDESAASIHADSICCCSLVIFFASLAFYRQNNYNSEVWRYLPKA